MLSLRPCSAGARLGNSALTSSSNRSLVSVLSVGVLALLLCSCGGGGGGSEFLTPASSGTGSSGTGGSTAPVTPVWSIGNGSGSGFKDGIIDSNKTTLDSGDTATLRVNVVDQANNPPTTDMTVTFASTCSSTGLASFGAVSQITRGLFSVDYTNRGCDRAADTVVATLSSNNKQASINIKMVGPDVVSVSFVSATNTQLALAGIGGNETSELIFRVVGPQGVPVIGKTVDFSINTKVGGATILAGRGSATTDQAGQVRTVINSGTIAGPVNIKAVERSTGKQGISPDITISSGVPAAKYFSLSQSHVNVPNAVDRDGTVVTFTIIASDAFGNNPTDGTRITFVSPESGNIQSSCLLSNGTCSATWRSSSPRPADGRVTILAYTNGAEDFVDKNGNSVYDSADGAVTDLGEPYADTNDSNAYDVGEFFFDANKNGVRDAGNGKWDGPCLVKVDASAVCTGDSSAPISSYGYLVLSQDSAVFSAQGTFPAVGSSISIKQGTSVSYSGLMLKDGNSTASNPMPIGTTVAFSLQGGGASLQGITSTIVPRTSSPTGPYAVTIAVASVTAGSPLPVGLTLVLTTTFPSGIQQSFTWPITVTP